MDDPIGRERVQGQGTVEYLGVVLAVAILVAVAAFAVGRLRPDHRSPPQARAAVQLALAALAVAEPPKQPSGVRRIIHRVRAVAEGPTAFVRAFGAAGARDLRALVRDPIGVLAGGGGDLLIVLRDPGGTIITQLRAGRAYVDELRAMSPHDAYVRLMADAGELSEDLLVSRGKRAVAKRLARGARGVAREGGHSPGAGQGREGDRTP